jgi:DnaJ family protein C protein 7
MVKSKRPIAKWRSFITPVPSCTFVFLFVDKNQDPENKEAAEAKFKDIGEAYSTLSDPQKRRRYDSGADMQDLDGGMSGENMNDVFNMFFAGGGMGHGGFGGGGGRTYSGGFGHPGMGGFGGHSHGFHAFDDE